MVMPMFPVSFSVSVSVSVSISIPISRSVRAFSIWVAAPRLTPSPRALVAVPPSILFQGIVQLLVLLFGIALYPLNIFKRPLTSTGAARAVTYTLTPRIVMSCAIFHNLL